MPTLDPISQHSFEDPALLGLALTHSSCDRTEGHNQRLEFLGDAVLDLAIAEELFRKFPEADEGALDRARASLVNGQSLARIAERNKLGKYLEVSEAQRRHHPKPSPAMLEDALEALIGAVYLDGGLEAARHSIHRFFRQEFDKLALHPAPKNPKGELQEWSQKHHYGQIPVYKELPAEGPDHDRRYGAFVLIGGHELGRGFDSSKKAAEAKAAQAALEAIQAI